MFNQSLRKLQKSKSKGFTLVEVLVAISLLMLVVFAFSPFLLHSLDDIYFAGQRRAEMFQDRGNVEKALALQGEGLPHEELWVAFQDEDGNVSPAISSTGVLIESGSLTTFYSNTEPAMTVSPAVVSEGSGSATNISIIGSFLSFTNPDLFSLKENLTGSTVSGVTVSLSAGNPYLATMTVPPNLLNMAGAPYGVYYGDTFAPLRVDPPDLVAVGAGGNYFASNGNGVWAKQNFPSSSNITTNSLNDAEWTGEQYLIPANEGKIYFSAGGWQDSTQTPGESSYQGLVLRDTVNPPNITAVHYSPFWNGGSGEYFTGSTYTVEHYYWLFGWRLDGTDTHGFITTGSTPEELATTLTDDIENVNTVDSITTGVNSSGQPIRLMSGKYTNSGNKGYLYYYNDATKQETIITRAGSTELQRVKEVAWKETSLNSEGQTVPGQFKAVGDNSIYSSPNGDVWSIDTLPGSNKPSSFNSISFGAGKWVAVGNSNYCLVYDTTAGSPAWVSRQIRSSSATFNRVAYIGGKFYACGNNGLIYSSGDEAAATWVQETTGSTANLLGIAGR